MKKVSSSLTPVLKFGIPVLVLLFVAFLSFDAISSGPSIFNVGVAIAVSGVSSVFYFMYYFRAADAWIADDGIRIKENRIAKMIGFSEIDSVESETMLAGHPITLKLRDGSEVIFFPSDIGMPLGEPKIVKEIKERMMLNQAAHTTPAIAPR